MADTAESEHPALKILVVSDELAWPLRTGLRRRLAQSLSALSGAGEVTWLACPRSGEMADPCLPSHLELADARVIPAPTRPLVQTAIRWATGQLPWALAGANWNHAEDALADLADVSYDLVWVGGFDAWLATVRAGIKAKHVVVDAADVESEKLKLRMQRLSEGPSGLRSSARKIIGRVDLRRWTKLEARAQDEADAISVCSDDEAAALSGATWTVPNSYPDPGPVSLQRTNDRLLFVGSLDYPPNIDGLEFFVGQVLETIREQHPTVELRVIGRGLKSDHWIRETGGVEVFDRVEDIGPEVAKAAATIVPLLWGGGTRLKIIESFAFSTPVVSTTIGAAGLGVVDGDQLLIGDTSQEFATACNALLGDPEAAVTLGRAGRAHYEAHFTASAVEAQLRSRIANLIS